MRRDEMDGFSTFADDGGCLDCRGWEKEAQRLQAEVKRLRELRDGDQEEIERLMREIRMTEDTKTTNQ